MNARQKCVVFGGTKGMGRALSRALVEDGSNVVLLGRGREDLDRSAADLRARAASGIHVSTADCDLKKPATFGPALDRATRALDGLELVVVTAGVFATQDKLEGDAEATEQVLALDFTNTILFCEQVRARLLARGGGTLCVFSSVAGDRGRSTQVLYGAAKAGLSAYLEGLDARYRRDGLITVCVKPGFVRTGMTDGLKPPPFVAEPEEVARTVLGAIDRGQAVVYAPGLWRGVMAVVRALPRFVMRRARF